MTPGHNGAVVPPSGSRRIAPGSSAARMAEVGVVVSQQESPCRVVHILYYYCI